MLDNIIFIDIIKQVKSKNKDTARAEKITDVSGIASPLLKKGYSLYFEGHSPSIKKGYLFCLYFDSLPVLSLIVTPTQNLTFNSLSLYCIYIHIYCEMNELIK